MVHCGNAKVQFAKKSATNARNGILASDWRCAGTEVRQSRRRGMLQCSVRARPAALAPEARSARAAYASIFEHASAGESGSPFGPWGDLRPASGGRARPLRASAGILEDCGLRVTSGDPSREVGWANPARRLALAQSLRSMLKWHGSCLPTAAP